MHRREKLALAAGVALVAVGLVGAVLAAGAAAQSVDMVHLLSSGEDSPGADGHRTIVLYRGSGLLGPDDEVALEPGAVVIGVVADGPADKAGVQRGDLVLAAAGHEVNDGHDLALAIDGKRPGEVVTLVVRHGDDERTLDARLGGDDEEGVLGLVVHPGLAGPDGIGPGEVLLDRLGAAESSRIGGLVLSRAEGRKFGPLELPEGVAAAYVIGTVEKDGPADTAGLRSGDFVVAVDGGDVDADVPLADLVRSRKVGQEIVFTIVRAGQEDTLDLPVELAERPGTADEPWIGAQPLGVVRIDWPADGAREGRLRIPFGRGDDESGAARSMVLEVVLPDQETDEE